MPLKKPFFVAPPPLELSAGSAGSAGSSDSAGSVGGAPSAAAAGAALSASSLALASALPSFFGFLPFLDLRGIVRTSPLRASDAATRELPPLAERDGEPRSPISLPFAGFSERLEGAAERRGAWGKRRKA